MIPNLTKARKTAAVSRLRPIPLFCAIVFATVAVGWTAGSRASSVDSKSNRVWIAVDGRDQTCRRNDRRRPCATFDRAYHVARGGDLVVVAGGRYPVTAPSEGATYIDPDSSKRAAVVFACRGNGAVTFAAPVFAFRPGLAGVVFRGSCFHFHVPYFGYGGGSRPTQNITLDGVHMQGFDCPGCKNVTIRDSTIGPFVACYMPNDGYGAPSYAYCNESDPAQAYWASVGGTTVVQQEPFIHGGASADAAVRFRLEHDHVHGITSKWSDSHTGCLQTWNTDGLIITNSTFDHCAIYDINMSAPSIDNNVTITNNTFGPPVYSLDPTEHKPNGELPVSFSEGQFGATSYGFDSNWLIQGNTFTHGIRMGGDPESTYRNARVLNNHLGPRSDCAGNGVIYKGNTGSCRGR